MPYIITTNRRRESGRVMLDTEMSRRAVATLAEVVPVLNATGADWTLDGPNGESGGTVGPLPDGTVIEVKHVMMPEIMRGAGLSRRDTPMMSDRAIIDAYNEATA